MDDMRVHVRVRIDCDMNIPQKKMGPLVRSFSPKMKYESFSFFSTCPPFRIWIVVLKPLAPKSVRTTEIKHAIVI